MRAPKKRQPQPLSKRRPVLCMWLDVARRAARLLSPVNIGIIIYAHALGMAVTVRDQSFGVNKTEEYVCVCSLL